jgi:hypothetical protein
MRIVFLFALLASVAAQAARADDAGWVRLRGGDIAEALAARSMIFDNGATQDFSADGRTRYGRTSKQEGRWDVADDQYCSVWPPSETRDCYDLERSADGTQVRFTSVRGGYSIGTYTDLE